MGRPIASNLLRAGFDVVVHSRSPGPVEALAAEGARVCRSPSELPGQTDVILTVLPGAAAAESVIVEGIVASGVLRAGHLIADLSTIAPSAAIRIGAAVEGAGGRFLDAPMSGGEAGAIEGTLSLMVGGAAEDVARARPVFEAIADRVTHVGPVGSGQVAKACNQLVVMGSIELVAEALTLARSAGVDPAKVREAMLGGLASSRVLELAGARMLERDFEPGGRASFHAKDIATIRELGAADGHTLPGFEAAAAAMERLIAAGGGDLDHAALVTEVERRAAAPPGAITFTSDSTTRLYELPGRDWSLLLGPQNSPSRRMTMSLAVFPAGSAPDLHVHRVEDELVYVLSGSGRLEADGGGGELRPGVSFHVPAGLRHGAVNDGAEPLALLCIFSPPVTPASYDPPMSGDQPAS
jgi:2-hydroxy-3-oxopropionate reductase